MTFDYPRHVPRGEVPGTGEHSISNGDFVQLPPER
jgi:hypothetical protein